MWREFSRQLHRLVVAAFAWRIIPPNYLTSFPSFMSILFRLGLYATNLFLSRLLLFVFIDLLVIYSIFFFKLNGFLGVSPTLSIP